MLDGKIVKEAYDKDNLKPIIKSNMSTGEKVAGFIDLKTGEFIKTMLIKNSSDIDFFLEKYEISIAEVKNE